MWLYIWSRQARRPVAQAGKDDSVAEFNTALETGTKLWNSISGVPLWAKIVGVIVVIVVIIAVTQMLGGEGGGE